MDVRSEQSERTTSVLAEFCSREQRRTSDDHHNVASDSHNDRRQYQGFITDDFHADFYADLHAHDSHLERNVAGVYLDNCHDYWGSGCRRYEASTHQHTSVFGFDELGNFGFWRSVRSEDRQCLGVTGHV